MTHARGEDGAATPSSTTVTVTTDAETQTAFSNLKNEQTIFFQTPKLQLSKALHVNGVSNLTIKSVEGTELKCPDGDASITVREGKNIIIEGFNFTGCRHSSAVQIFGRISQTKGEKSEGELNFEGCSVLVKSCRFNGNTKSSLGNPSVYFGNDLENDNGLGGAAISGYGCDLSIAQTHFHNNSAVNGGAIDLLKGSLHVSETQFEKNRANDIGGAVSLNSLPSVFEKCLIEYNVAGSYAGGVGIYGGGGTFRECTLRSNRADRGGGVAGLFGNLTVTNSNFTNNSAASDGAAAFLFGARAIIRDSKFESHTSTHGTIGLGKSNADIERCNFSSNTANSGGALFSYENSQLICKSSNFIDNTATKEHGGAAYVDNSDSKFIDCKFTSNTAERHGGAAYVIRRTTSFHSCEFTKNKAKEFGGGAHIESERANVDNCHFEENKVDDLGGAIAMVGGKASITTTRFTNNTAKRGGVSQFQNVEAEIRSCSFQLNFATLFGGAVIAQLSKVKISNASFSHNEALKGGAIYLDHGTKLVLESDVTTNITFEENLAIDGGALCCDQCGEVKSKNKIRLYFVRNLALRSGGALYFEGGYGFLQRSSFCRFEGNRARRGGAMYFSNSGELEINHWHLHLKDWTEFINNEATMGGAIFFSSQFEGHTSNIVRILLNHRNKAWFSELEKTPRPRSFLNRLKGTQYLEVANDLLAHQGNDTPVGGAIYMELLNRREMASVTFTLAYADVENNTADIGGGIYIFDSYRESVDRSFKKCTEDDIGIRPCQRLEFDRVKVYNNTAFTSAGGLFVRDIFGFKYICDEDVFDGKNFNNTCINVANNTVPNATMSLAKDTATNVAELRVSNVEGKLEKLVPEKRIKANSKSNVTTDSSSQDSWVEIEVLDMFGQVIRSPNIDSNVSLVLVSDDIGGHTEYKAKNGTVKINETIVRTADVSDGQLVIRTKADLGVAKTLNFSTTSCPDAAIMDHDIQTCDRCQHNGYAFEKISECLLCEDNAICSGTTVLVPVDGYWHSTPFAPRMIECLIKEACTRENRSESLKDYYMNTTMRTRDLGRFDGETNIMMTDFEESYDQCSEGYTGIICGACAEHYGRSIDGTCKPCSSRKWTHWALRVLGVITFVVVFSVKLWIGYKATRAEILDLRQRRGIALYRAVANILMLKRPTTFKRSERSQINSRRAFTNLVRREEESQSFLDEDGAVLAEEGSRHLTRCPPVRSDQFVCDHCDRNRKCLAVMKVAESMFVTYEVLLEYMQLNSIALSLDIDWDDSISNMLSVQGALSRLRYVTYTRPLECDFNYSRANCDAPTLVLIFVRSLLPILLLGCYVIISQLFLSSQKQHSRSVAVSTAYIFFFGFYTYLLDIVGGFFSILSFAKLPKKYRGNVNSKYDILNTRYVWAVDASYQYFTGVHRTAAIVALVGLAFCAGVLIRSTVILTMAKTEEARRDERFIRRYGYLFSSTNAEGLAGYWLLLTSLRNVVLSCVAITFSTIFLTTRAKIGFAFIVIFTNYGLHILVAPFKTIDFSVSFPAYSSSIFECLGWHRAATIWNSFHRSVSTNFLQAAALLMSLGVYGVAGSIEKHGASKWCSEVTFFACFITNILFMCFMFYRIWMGFHKLVDLRVVHKFGHYGRSYDPRVDADMSLLWKIRIWVSLELEADAALNHPILLNDSNHGAGSSHRQSNSGSAN